ncbi:hypothetical protein V5F53_20870, partial [Xanthobacter sp. V4C-4]|uniref:hypothetical protein n=1 Tax=Xanthobacter cornucopiae TaxID=3119924 RepID=UPI00372A10C1
MTQASGTDGHEGMMRLKISVEDKYLHRFDGWFEVKDKLSDLGWHIGIDIENPDLEMIQTQMIRALMESKDSRVNRPFIIYERSGSASIAPMSWRNYLKNKNVIGYAKETGFRDKSTYNKKHVQGRYHHTLISDDIPEEPFPMLDDSELEKIETIFQIYAHSIRYKDLKFSKLKKYKRRTSDVLFSGSVDYDVDIITNHRKNCCKVLSNIENANILIGIGRSLSQENWASILSDTKICVSPYGYGEYSWKDYEALYAGCILIKPTSNFVTTHGFDIYKEGAHCIECKPDFSDLEKIVHEVLNDEEKWANFAFKAHLA